jgi:Type II secretion system (T2SS), protein E, N-terminal domain
MTESLDFPSLSIDAWAPTAPMAFEGETAPPKEIAPCPWGFEMMGAECTIDHADGRRLVGKLVQWDPSSNRCLFRAAPDYAEMMLPLTRLRRATLTEVLPPGSTLGWGVQATETGLMTYRLQLEGGASLEGVALEHLERPEGHYVAHRVSAAGAFVRLFVPARAVLQAQIVHPAQARAAAVAASERRAAAAPVARPAATAAQAAPAPILRFEPVSSVPALQQAIKAQAGQSVRRIGDILLALELISVDQLATTLSQGQGNAVLPLGERLVRMGLISPEGLQRALHLKMGYPLVDLRRFPFDRELLQRLPYKRAAELEVLLLGRAEDGRYIVALDDPGRLPTLKELGFLLNAQLVAVLPWSDPVRHIIPVAYGVQGIGSSGVGWFG